MKKTIQFLTLAVSLTCLPWLYGDVTIILPGDPADYTVVEGRSTSPGAPCYYAARFTWPAAVGAWPYGGCNVVYLFALPVLESNARVLSAQLSFRLDPTVGNVTFNADLWGIGFQTNTLPLLEHFEANANDRDNIKLQEHILTPGMAAGTQITSAANSGLAAYLQSFYDANPDYEGGAYVFLRLNPDADAGTEARGYMLNMAESGTPPTLTLTVSGTGTMFVRRNYSASLGASVAMQFLAAGGIPPLSYQWWFNGAAIPGATDTLLVVPNVQLADAGNYYAVIQDGTGLSVTGCVATLDVDPTFTKIMQGEIVQGEVVTAWLPYWVDIDDDGDLDLVVSAGLSDTAGSAFLVYENLNNGTFQRNRTNALATAVGRWISLAWGDFDNDGYVDVYAGQHETAVGSYFRNLGGWRFVRVLADTNWTVNGADVFGMSVAAGDLNRDGYLDIVAGYYGNWARGFYGTNSVLHGVGGGRFEVVRNSPLAFSGAQTMSIAVVDVNDDGFPDLFGTSDEHSLRDWLYSNQGGTNFTAVNNVLTTTPDATENSVWGDLDNDGILDVVLSVQSSDLVYRNLGSNQFVRMTNGPSIAMLSATAALADYDNDGHLDLFVVYLFGGNRLFHNNGDGTFAEVLRGSPANENPENNYGAAWGDYDNDGFMDLFVAGRTGRNLLYRNSLPQNGNTNRWLKIKPVGTVSNRSAIGAKIRVKATIGGQTFWQMRLIASQSHQLELSAHFGLGDATNVDVRIEWPSGIVQELTCVAAGQILTVTEPAHLRAAGLTNGLFHFALPKNVRRAYRVEASTDLTTWQIFDDAPPTTTPSQQFQDQAPAGSAYRFYRVKVLPLP